MAAAGVGEALQALADVVARLRGPNGCPWDRAQTHASLLPYLLEEAYEVAEALRGDDPLKLREELGDLLLQVVLHAQIACEQRAFTLADVATALREKLIRRHPHVFGDAKAGDPDEVRRTWESVKREEGAVPDLARPALLAARKHLEAGGMPPAAETGTCLDVEAEPADPEVAIGELLMHVVSLAHRWGVEPEYALRRHLTTRDGPG